MHILVLGGGGREHAIVKAVKQSSKVTQVSCAPGNPGIAQEATCYLTDPMDTLRTAELARRLNPDLIIVGAEGPLAAGVTDRLRVFGYNVFGPSKEGAKLETSKVFSKNFMKTHNIPTPKFIVCQNRLEAEVACQQFKKPWVIKADGIASGKGVRICHSEIELEQCFQDFFDKKRLGTAADQVVVEEYLGGEEISLLTLVADHKFALLPLAQDYKKLNEKDKGPNTGGMGAYAPVKIKSNHFKKILSQIVEPTINALKLEKIDYRGVLYFGIMIKGPDVFLLEYNVRFGDPEAQVILPLLKGSWAQVFQSVAQNKLPKLAWNNKKAVCVVLAAPGYPDEPKKGISIKIDHKKVKTLKANYLLHASTASHRGYITNGGRVLNLVGLDIKLPVARKKAYDLIKLATFENMQFRKDIAKLK